MRPPKCRDCGGTLLCVLCGHTNRPKRPMSKARKEAAIAALVSGPLPPPETDERLPEGPEGLGEAPEDSGAS